MRPAWWHRTASRAHPAAGAASRPAPGTRRGTGPASRGPRAPRPRPLRGRRALSPRQPVVAIGPERSGAACCALDRGASPRAAAPRSGWWRNRGAARCAASMRRPSPVKKKFLRLGQAVLVGRWAHRGGPSAPQRENVTLRPPEPQRSRQSIGQAPARSQLAKLPFALWVSPYTWARCTLESAELGRCNLRNGLTEELEGNSSSPSGASQSSGQGVWLLARRFWPRSTGRGPRDSSWQRMGVS